MGGDRVGGASNLWIRGVGGVFLKTLASKKVSDSEPRIKGL